MELIFVLLFSVMALGGIFATAVGVMVMFFISLEKRTPMDSSNRINHIRLVWWALSKPEMFVEMYPWLTKDEGENIQ